MSWAVFGLLLILGVLLSVLSVPLSFAAEGCYSAGERRVSAWVSWGLLKLKMLFPRGRHSSGLWLAGVRIPVKSRKRAAARVKRAKKREGKRGGLKTLARKDPSLLSRDLLAAATAFLRRCLRALNLRVSLTGVFGTDDPALTGVLTGMAAVLEAANVRLDLTPDFSGPAADLTGTIEGRFVPIILLWLVLGFFLSRPVRRLWWGKVFKKRNKTKEVLQHV